LHFPGFGNRGHNFLVCLQAKVHVPNLRTDTGRRKQRLDVIGYGARLVNLFWSDILSVRFRGCCFLSGLLPGLRRRPRLWRIIQTQLGIGRVEDLIV
jgi:hypothetical protein